MAQPEVKFGRYHVLSRLASGGMAEVWLGEFRGHGGFAKRVVLKTMRPELARHDELVQMFIAEASIAARLDHENIVTVYDFGEHEGVFFIAMEHVTGRTLRQIARCPNRDRAADLWFLCRTAVEVCGALKYVHDFDDGGEKSLGLVHRDVSPENVMVSFTGAVKLLDFGIVAANQTAKLTQSEMLLGKCRYMAPERLTNANGVPASDLFSVGVLLYEMATGVSPFAADSDAAVLHRVLEYHPPPPSAIAPHLPELFDELVMKALEKDVNKRYQSGDLLANDLREFLRAWDSSSLTRPIDRYMGQLFPNAPELPKYLRAPAPAQAVKPEAQIEVMIDAVLEPGSEPPESTIVEEGRAAEPPLATLPPGPTNATLAPTLELPALQRPPLGPTPPVPPDATPSPLSTPLPDIFRRATTIPPPSVATDLFSRPPLLIAPVMESGQATVTRDVFVVSSRSAHMATPIFGGPTQPTKPQGLAAFSTAQIAPDKEPTQGLPPPRDERPKDSGGMFASSASAERVAPPATSASTGRHDPFAPITRTAPSASTGSNDFFSVSRRGDAKPAPPPEDRPEKAPSAGEQRRASQLFERGFQHYSNKSYHAALEAWREALALEPNNRSYQSNLKRLEQQLEKLKNQH